MSSVDNQTGEIKMKGYFSLLNQNETFLSLFSKTDLYRLVSWIKTKNVCFEGVLGFGFGLKRGEHKANVPSCLVTVVFDHETETMSAESIWHFRH